MWCTTETKREFSGNLLLGSQIFATSHRDRMSAIQQRHSSFEEYCPVNERAAEVLVFVTILLGKLVYLLLLFAEFVLTGLSAVAKTK